MGKQLIPILIFLCILQGLLFWPFAYFPMQSPLNFLTIIILLSFRFKVIYTNAYPSLWISLVLIALYLVIIDGVLVSLPFILCYVLGILIYSLNSTEKQIILLKITRWFSILIGLSLCLYLLYLIINFSAFSIIRNPWGYDDHKNFILFIVPANNFFIRFSGPFIEPGHLGVFSSFLLFANKYNFKQSRNLWIILLGVIFSLSLAGYLLTTLGFILLQKIKIKYVIISLLILLGAHITITKLWSNGNNIANLFIYERLAFDEEKGIAGNNRVQYNTEKYYQMMIDDASIMTGKGNSYYREMYNRQEIGGAGIKIFLIQYGLIGLMLIGLYYILIASTCMSRAYAVRYLIVIAVCFLQRAYPFHIYWLAPFVLSMNQYNNNMYFEYHKVFSIHE